MKIYRTGIQGIPLVALPQFWNHPLMMPPAELTLQNTPTEQLLPNHPMAIPCSQGCGMPPTVKNKLLSCFFRVLHTYCTQDFPGYRNKDASRSSYWTWSGHECIRKNIPEWKNIIKVVECSSQCHWDYSHCSVHNNPSLSQANVQSEKQEVSVRW